MIGVQSVSSPPVRAGQAAAVVVVALAATGRGTAALEGVSEGVGLRNVLAVRSGQCQRQTPWMIGELTGSLYLQQIQIAAGALAVALAGTGTGPGGTETAPGGIGMAPGRAGLERGTGALTVESLPGLTLGTGAPAGHQQLTQRDPVAGTAVATASATSQCLRLTQRTAGLTGPSSRQIPQAAHHQQQSSQQSDRASS
jgi:hypothetical protein